MKGSAFEPGLSLLSHYTGYFYAGTKPARASLPRRSGGWGGSLPHRRFQGSSFFIPPHRLGGGVGYSQPGYVFWYFVLNRVSILSIFVGRWRGPRDSVDQAVNSFVIANGLNKREFRYLLLSYTGYDFGVNVVNRVSKIEFCLKQGRKISDFCL